PISILSTLSLHDALPIYPTVLVAYVATYQDLMWVLDDAQQQLLLRLTPSTSDNDRAAWGMVFAQPFALRRDLATARVYADSARLDRKSTRLNSSHDQSSY